MISDSIIYAAACLAMLVAYLLVGYIFWNMVKAKFENDVQAHVMAEQERNGHLAMLIPKFSVIMFWPLVGMLAVLAALTSSLRREAPSV